ncbi:DUF1553 domain-containing protein [bacterium]|nr:DUF1553 domain-containing protein [bacterium]
MPATSNPNIQWTRSWRSLELAVAVLILTNAVKGQSAETAEEKAGVKNTAESRIEPSPATSKVDYLTEIKPILVTRCYACHGALQKKAGLRLDTVEFMRKGGDGGDVLDRDSPILLDRLTADDPHERMPPEGEGTPLAADQVAKIRTWIEAGAPAPESETPESSPRDHWAFRPIERPAVPKTKNTGWGRNPIDAFILAKLEAKGLSPAPAAEPGIQLRRLYIDLTGLPPTQPDSDKWRERTTDSQYRQLVTKLLSDPAHGERWGRHWMDIWRYSDWWGLGTQLRNSQKNIWHWRDWIVESLNADVPYDRMIRLMLAADEIEPGNLADLRATGYLARNYFLFNRNQWLDETVEHVGKGFLGLTVNCAKCHDHKYDPISQPDYYAMRAIFEPYMVRNDVAEGGRNTDVDGLPRAYDARPEDPTWLFVRGDDKNPDKSRKIEPGVPSFLDCAPYMVKRLELPAQAVSPGLRADVRKAQLELAREKLARADAEWAEADKAWKTVTAAKAKKPDKPADAAKPDTGQSRGDELSSLLSRTLAEKNRLAAGEWALAVRARIEADSAVAGNLPASQASLLSTIAAKAERRHALAAMEAEVAKLELDAAKADEKAREAVIKSLEQTRAKIVESRKAVFEAEAKPLVHTPIPGGEHARTMFMSSTAFDPDPATPAYSTGRRRALADWIVEKRNPLTARVAVNHIWARHFGEPLVPTVFDLGRKGQPATHPDLLDWLAAELIESGWSMKHLHRLIVESSAYRMSSSIRGREENQSADPDNRLIWHRSPVRVESQVVRDMLLDLAGNLDRKMGGPPVQPADQEKSNRRSLYFFHSNNDRNSFLTTFDEALVRDCYRRDRSIVPQQALALSNASLVANSVGPIADRFVQELRQAGVDPVSEKDFVRHAFARILSFEPTAEESAACLETMKSWASGHPPESAMPLARKRLIWALINHNDFVTLR